MTLSIKHNFQSAKTNSTDPTVVQPSNWNDTHAIHLDTVGLLGCFTEGGGAVIGLPVIGATLDGNGLTITPGFASGTVLLFAQAAAPTGWTQITLGSDTAIRLVSGAGGALHGSVGLSAFVAEGALGTVLYVPHMPWHDHGFIDPEHVHQMGADVGIVGAPCGGDGGERLVYGSVNATQPAATNITFNGEGGGVAHIHALPDLQYYDVISCRKD